MGERTKAELIGQVLERMAEGRFEIVDDGEGEVVTIKNYGTTFEEKEWFFDEVLEEVQDILDNIRDRIEEGEDGDLQGLLPGKEDWNDFCTEVLLVKLLGQERGRRLVKQIEGISYEKLVLRLYAALVETPQVRDSVKRVIEGRQQLSTTQVEQIETRLTALPQGEVADMLADEYATRMAKLIPKMVRRAETLRVLPASAPVAAQVQQYLREGSECYVLGRFIACLLVCRSAIELALRDFLRREGKEAELQSLRAEQGDGLWGMIKLARSFAKWTLKPTLDDADEVRRKANDAAHEGAPPAETCKELFIKTRGVLRELYS